MYPRVRVSIVVLFLLQMPPALGADGEESRVSVIAMCNGRHAPSIPTVRCANAKSKFEAKGSE